MAAWIKMSLGTEVGLVLREIVFDVDPATPRKRADPPPPHFGPCLLWPNGWMDERRRLVRIDLGPGHIVLDGGPSSRERAQQPPPLFSAHVYVATVAHLSYC